MIIIGGELLTKLRFAFAAIISMSAIKNTFFWRCMRQSKCIWQERSFLCLFYNEYLINILASDLQIHQIIDKIISLLSGFVVLADKLSIIYLIPKFIEVKKKKLINQIPNRPDRKWLNGMNKKNLLPQIGKKKNESKSNSILEHFLIGKIGINSHRK